MPEQAVWAGGKARPWLGRHARGVSSSLVGRANACQAPHGIAEVLQRRSAPAAESAQCAAQGPGAAVGVGAAAAEEAENLTTASGGLWRVGALILLDAAAVGRVAVGV